MFLYSLPRALIINSYDVCALFYKHILKRTQDFSFTLWNEQGTKFRLGSVTA